MDTTANISYKEAHERFVSGQTGTTVSEISVIACSGPVAVLLRNTVCRALNRQTSWHLRPVTFDITASHYSTITATPLKHYKNKKS